MVEFCANIIELNLRGLFSIIIVAIETEEICKITFEDSELEMIICITGYLWLKNLSSLLLI